jgi:monoamine oxidase
LERASALVLRPLAQTRWDHDHWARGSYSHALPGKADARSRLVFPIQDRLFFAGEAVSPHLFSTAHGAAETGRRAAGHVLRALGALPSG